MNRKEAIKEAETQIDVYESMILYNKHFDPKNDNSNYERKIEFLKVAIAALQEPERILKQLEELRDDPIMHCSEDYWEGHYMAAKEAIAIVIGEE